KKIYTNHKKLMTICSIPMYGLSIFFSTGTIVIIAGAIIEGIDQTFFDEKIAKVQEIIVIGVYAPSYVLAFVGDSVFMTIVGVLIYRYLNQTTSAERKRPVVKRLLAAILSMIIGNLLRLPGLF